MKNPSHSDLWERAAEASEAGETVDWQEAPWEYEATVDWAGYAFYSELAAAYPHSKVLYRPRATPSRGPRGESFRSLRLVDSPGFATSCR